VSRQSLKGRQAKPYPLSWTEQDRLLKLLPRHLADAALFAVNTGCREQEVCQLRWDWEVKLPQMKTSVFILPAAFTKTGVERVVVLNAIAGRVVDSRRGMHSEHVFTFRGKPVTKLHNSAWKRAWQKAGLPTEQGILKGVHNLRHTFGRRLRAAGVPLETRKALLGHSNGDITTHYSAAELNELIHAAESIVTRGRTETPNLMLIGMKAEENVGKLSEKEKGLAKNFR
jgi:integrase